MNDLASRARPVAPSSGSSTTRRQFLGRIPAGAGAAVASSAVSFRSSAKTGEGQDNDPGSVGTERVLNSYEVREQAARSETKVPVPTQITNGDEQRYSNSNFIANFSKGLPHNSLGEVDPSAYRSLLNGLRQGTSKALEDHIVLGDDPGTKLVNPLAGLAFDLEGTDSHQLKIPPFPELNSKALADQAVELYWMALCRDVNFSKYGIDPTTIAAVKELKVTSQTLFRGFTAGDLIGPYVSQFLIKPFNYGPYAMNGLMTVAKAGIDYLTDVDSWLKNQNGTSFAGNPPDSTPQSVRNGRDLATYVHTDPNAGLFMSFYNAGIFLFENGTPLNPGNPYRDYDKQSPFGTFGVPFFLGLIGEAAARAFKAAWYAKWFVHRALRPDQYGGLVHWRKTKTGQKSYSIHPDILNSPVLDKIYQYSKALNANNGLNGGTYLLPQAYPEAGPQHPSYPSGHATMAGACATILKAAFDGGAAFADLIDNTVVAASVDGSPPVSVGKDPGLTIGGEIDKLASNIAFGRNFAGIHWRSDAEEGMRLGEAVALSILRDQGDNYPGENFKGFTITTFDGENVIV
jgi:membrane-associated phospholipid phosphatase